MLVRAGQAFALPVDDRALQVKPADELGPLIGQVRRALACSSHGQRRYPSLTRSPRTVSITYRDGPWLPGGRSQGLGLQFGLQFTGIQRRSASSASLA